MPGGSVSGNGIDNDNIFVQIDCGLLQNENYTTTLQQASDTNLCLHNSENAASENEIPPGAVQSENCGTGRSPIDCSTCSKPAETVQKNRPSAAKSRKPVNARHYKPLELPEPKTACYACGKKGSWYVEKLTAERKARPKDQQDAHRICRACYKAAVKDAQMAAVLLPGGLWTR